MVYFWWQEENKCGMEQLPYFQRLCCCLFVLNCLDSLLLRLLLIYRKLKGALCVVSLSQTMHTLSPPPSLSWSCCGALNPGLSQQGTRKCSCFRVSTVQLLSNGSYGVTDKKQGIKSDSEQIMIVNNETNNSFVSYGLFKLLRFFYQQMFAA